MPDNRRRFLVTSAASLSTLLLPTHAMAGLFGRREKRVTAAVYPAGVTPAVPCPGGFLWLNSTNPTIPDSANFTQSTWHSITVYGEGLYNCASNGGVFAPLVSDPNHTNISWKYYPVCYVTSNPGYADSLQFFAEETGSTPGGSTITVSITVTSPPLYAQCPKGYWPNLPITYS